jgi:iron-only hydrogenase group A
MLKSFFKKSEKQIPVWIDGKKCMAHEGESILQVAIRHDIDIPHFCYHEDLPMDANCRTCLVEDEATKKVTTSCTLKASPGLKVLSQQSVKAKRMRKQNMELLLAGHKKLCVKCKNKWSCATADKMKRYGVTGEKYSRDNKDACPLHKLGTVAEFDPKICIDCNKCVEMCEKIGVGFLVLNGKGSKTRIDYNQDPKVDCIYCGQCTVHCPVGAVREQSHLDAVEKVLKDKKKIVIVQTAPSVRASIGEEFGMAYGQNLIGKLSTAYRLLGFDKVFDVNMGADITTIVEAEELVHRIQNKGVLPMFTSCCPGWVKYVEFYHPELIPHLTTARSPQIHSGGAYKTWWAAKEGINPKNIVVVSIMPCTSKKYEAGLKELKISNWKPVDYVLTTRELATLIKKNKIDFPNLKSSEIDPYGEYSGAAAIYGASGGVMESALRSAHDFITGKDLKKVEFQAVRGMEGIKKAMIEIGDLKLNVAVVATVKNIPLILNELKKNPKAYDYIEVMACPGGCIGGGGQPIPSTEAIVKERTKGLYAIDKKKKIRKAHQNPVVQDFFKYVKTLSKEKQHALLHRSYSKKEKFK